MIQCARIAFAFTGIFDEDEAERIVEEKDITPRQPVPMPKAVDLPKEPEVEGEILPPCVPRETIGQLASENQISEIRKRMEKFEITESELCAEFFLEKLEDLPMAAVLNASKFIRGGKAA
jgi:hypothetical protein